MAQFYARRNNPFILIITPIQQLETIYTVGVSTSACAVVDAVFYRLRIVMVGEMKD
ncbi:MAG: hypothetical protein IKU32_04245 [Clostridia bacterium]|nr:hypothetical protein [Clostridia bacterium]